MRVPRVVRLDKTIEVPMKIHKFNNGFTLFEVLISVLVLSVGLLGLAGLETAGQRDNHSAYLRSQAVLMAYDMVDRMRANMGGVTAGDYDSISGIPSDPGCLSSGCSAAQMAQYDAYEWNTQLAQLLPSGQGKVAKSGSMFTVTVMWDDDRSGATGTGCGAGDLKCLTVSTQL